MQVLCARGSPRFAAWRGNVLPASMLLGLPLAWLIFRVYESFLLDFQRTVDHGGPLPDAGKQNNGA